MFVGFGSAGIGSHIVLVRGFNQDQTTYRFPRSEAYGWAVLRIDLPDGAAWIDPTYRLGPFDELPPFLRDQDAWVVPEPSEEPQRIRTPGSSSGDGREITLSFALDANGAAEGTGRDRHLGFEAAGLKDALERLDDTQRKQAVESMLSRGLHGVELDSLRIEGETEVGGEATGVYGMRVQLARKDGPRLFVPASLVPEALSRRWAQRAERALPLLVDTAEKQTTRSEIALPARFHLASPPPPVTLRTPFGEFSWNVREERGHVVVQESFAMPQQRVKSLYAMESCCVPGRLMSMQPSSTTKLGSMTRRCGSLIVLLKPMLDKAKELNSTSPVRRPTRPLLLQLWADFVKR